MGDTYSRDLADFILGRLSRRYSIQKFEISNISFEDVSFLIYSPTQDGRERELLQSARDRGLSIVQLLDHGHFTSGDFKRCAVTPDLRIQPKAYTHTSIRTIEWSAYEAFVQKNVRPRKPALRGVLFCSQPLFEDRRGIDQFNLLHEVQRLLLQRCLDLYVLRHPRESRSLPDSLANIQEYTGGPLDALAEDFAWVGYDSMPLFGAKFIGKKAFIIAGSDVGPLEKFLLGLAE